MHPGLAAATFGEMRNAEVAFQRVPQRVVTATDFQKCGDRFLNSSGLTEGQTASFLPLQQRKQHHIPDGRGAC